MLKQVGLEVLFGINFDDLYEYPESHVKFEAINEQRTTDVLLDDICLGLDGFAIHLDANFEGSLAQQLRKLFECTEKMDPSPSIEGGGLEYPQVLVFILLLRRFRVNLGRYLRILHQLIQGLLRYADVDEVILNDNAFAPWFFDNVLLKVVGHKLQQAFLHQALILPEVYNEGSRNVRSDRSRKIFLHVAKKTLLVCQLRLPLQIVVDHGAMVQAELADFGEVVLVETFGAPEQLLLLGTALEPANGCILPEGGFGEAMFFDEDLFEELVVVSFGEEEQLFPDFGFLIELYFELEQVLFSDQLGNQPVLMDQPLIFGQIWSILQFVLRYFLLQQLPFGFLSQR